MMFKSFSTSKVNAVIIWQELIFDIAIASIECSSKDEELAS